MRRVLILAVCPTLIFVVFARVMWVSIRHIVGEPMLPWAIGFCSTSLVALAWRHHRPRYGYVKEALVGAAVSYSMAMITNLLAQTYYHSDLFSRSFGHSVGAALLAVIAWPLVALAWLPGLLTGVVATIAVRVPHDRTSAS